MPVASSPGSVSSSNLVLYELVIIATIIAWIGGLQLGKIALSHLLYSSVLSSAFVEFY
jgi:hypothetical protein